VSAATLVSHSFLSDFLRGNHQELDEVSMKDLSGHISWKNEDFKKKMWSFAENGQNAPFPS